jgi:protein N-terminal amidase
MRIGCLQFTPIRGDFNATIKKVEDLLSKVSKGTLSLLIMPEMSFPGYSFSKTEIKELLDGGIQQKTIEWGKSFAKRMESFIQIGYPRAAEKIYNTVSLISPSGHIVYTYDKHFLFTADEAWASAGEGFKTFDCDPFGKVGPGICMDVNPYKFEASFDAFEFANFHVSEGTKFIFLSMAWLQSSNHTPYSLIYYWIQRLEPLIHESNKIETPIVVVICNRNGTEGDSRYAGSSCVLRFSRGRIVLMDHLNTDDEMLLTVDLDQF